MPDSAANGWSALREPLMNCSFSRIKTVAAAAGFPMQKLGHLSQAKVGNKSGASRQHLVDALDLLFAEMDSVEQDRSVRYMIEELAGALNGESRQRMGELLSRRGWALLENGSVVPLAVAAEVIGLLDESAAGTGLAKALERYRTGDLSGAVAAAVGAVETAAGVNPSDSDYTRRLMEALRPKMEQLEEEFEVLDAGEAKRVTGALQKSTSQTVELLASFRRSYSDVHGEANRDVSIGALRLMFHAAVYILNRLAAG